MPYLSLGKYSSGRDDVLHTMCLEQWANESDGDVESPTGYFWLVCNSNNELAEILDAFGEDISRCEVKMAELRGNFIVTKDSQGFVYVASFDTAALAKAEFANLVDEYAVWLDSEDE